MKKIRAKVGLVDQVRRIGTEWVDIVEALRTHCPGTGTEFLRQITSAARALAKSKKAEATERRAQSWKNFVSTQLQSGAAAAHRLTKRDGVRVVDAATVTVNGTR